MNNKRGSVMEKRGSVTALALLIATLLVVTAGALFFSNSELTGAVVVGKACEINITSDYVVGHDYECNSSYGFGITTSDITLDCADHKISCVDNCTDKYGVIIYAGVDQVTIKNCELWNFTDNIHIGNVKEDNSSTDNHTLLYNSLYEATNANLFLFNSSYNNISNNTLDGNEGGSTSTFNMYLGPGNYSTIFTNYFNDSTYGIYLANTTNTTYNNTIYNNYFSNTNNAYNNNTVASFNNFWNLSKTLGTNIIGGPYLGGNYWSDYLFGDTDGDGLGENPYSISLLGIDYLPLVNVAGICP
ncbi:hypothetical protein HOC13_02650, partial [Candidatus Woesearchaeota archaeon]|nr:hypothetical protein [Candidatus Woesearchaeota archaeon]